MRFSLFVALFLTALANALGANPGDIHGPICSWHLDPTSTMTIQWVERVNTTIPEERWWVAQAGFGYSDGDDETRLDMQDKYQRLYIRREFEAKDLPTIAEIDVTGDWKAVATVNETTYEFDIVFDFQDEKLGGTIQQGAASPREIKSGYVSGQSIHFTSDFSLVGIAYTIEVSAKPKDGKFEGEWRALNKDGEEKAKDSLTLERVETEEERKKSEEEKKKEAEEREKEAKKVTNTEAFQMEIRIRYDDAFIAYLNGEEILRQGVGEGRGKNAKDIKNHEAEKEEVFEIDKKYNRFLKPGNNILAIEGHNATIDSSDFTLDPKFWVKVDKKELKYLDGDGDEWAFFLGDPADDWTMGEIKTEPLPLLQDSIAACELRYGKRGDTALPHRVVTERLPFADTRQAIHRVILRDLEPDTGYAFEMYREGSSERLNRRKYFFKTAPAEMGQKLTFVAGGDMYHKRNLLDDMNREAAEHDPLFALLGGDLAYANGKEANKWYNWIDSWHEWCETNADYMIPMVVAIGNHECSKQIADVKAEERDAFKPEENAKFFYSLFPFPGGKSNYAIDFGDYMSIICLDSNHTQTPESQAPWLESALKQRQAVPNLFACYHKPAYGSLVKDDEEEVRKHFVPLFDRYGVDAAFENDHHVYKRTMPLKNDKIDGDGTLYIGDGAWGVDLRDIPWEKIENLDYLVRAVKEHHLIRVQLHPNRQQFDAFNGSGSRFDSTARFRR